MKFLVFIFATILTISGSSSESNCGCQKKYELVPLYLVSSNFCTISEQELAEFLIKNGSLQRVILALAATNNLDCQGRPNLRPVYRYTHATTGNYFYSTDRNPPTENAYSFNGVAFYAVTTANECEASVPLNRYWLRNKYVYATDPTVHVKIIKDGGRLDGIVCYVWPNPTVVVKPSCPINPVPLLRLFNPKTDNHFYTRSSLEAQSAVATLQYTQEGSPGRIALNATDCNCENSLIPVRRLYSKRVGPNGIREDHLYTASEEEAANAVANMGYSRERIEFYCSPKESLCGATVPLHRYLRNGFDHFYTNDLNEGNVNGIAKGAVYEGVLCYIWP